VHMDVKSYKPSNIYDLKFIERLSGYSLIRVTLIC